MGLLMRKMAILGLFLAFSGPAEAQAQIDWGLLSRKPGQEGQVYQSVAPLPAAAPTATMTCFIKGERQSGLNKLCFYDCLGSEYATNIASYGVCAPQVER